MRRVLAALAILIALTQSRPANAMWSHDPFNGGNPICTAPTEQQSQAVLPDGAGGMFIA